MGEGNRCNQAPLTTKTNGRRMCRLDFGHGRDSTRHRARGRGQVLGHGTAARVAGAGACGAEAARPRLLERARVARRR
jgi:hypothetical protein